MTCKNTISTRSNHAGKKVAGKRALHVGNVNFRDMIRTIRTEKGKKGKELFFIGQNKNKRQKSPNQALEWMAGSGPRRYAAGTLAAATQLGR